VEYNAPIEDATTESTSVTVVDRYTGRQEHFPLERNGRMTDPHIGRSA
jgi:hypothetical protein